MLKSKRQTTGSKRVRKEHYITFCCVRWYTAYLSCCPHGFREFLEFFLKNMSLWEQKPPRHGQFRPQGHGKYDFCRGSLNITIYVLNISREPHSFRVLFSIYSQWKIMAPRVWPVWTPWACWQDLCRGPPDIALYQKYISCRPELQWLKLWWLIHLAWLELSLWSLKVTLCIIHHYPWLELFFMVPSLFELLKFL